MLDHLIFNKLKWFSISDKQKTVKAGTDIYINLKNAFPVDAVLTKDTYAFPIDSNSSNLKISAGTHVKVLGFSFNSDGSLNFVRIEPYQSNWDLLYSLDWSHLNIKWGGKACLNALLARLRTTFRKVVPVC